ncbi:MAG: hypothetical protein WBB31_13160, partial [Saprospiraceae bacterium]
MMTSIKFLICICIVFCFSTGRIYSQSGYDLYLFSLHQNADGHNHVFSPKFLSNFNKGGYTYQP